jgi:hypothetical protein
MQVHDVALMGNLNPQWVKRHGGSQSFMEPFVLLRWAQAAARAPAQRQWVEVQRNWYPSAPEGVLYGCWFSQLLEPFPRGAGVFVNVGHSISFPNKAVAQGWAAAFRRTNRTDHHCASWRTANVPPDLRYLSAAEHLAPAGSKALIFKHLAGFGDNMLASCSREMGLDSLDMHAGASGRPELVLASPECTWPGQVLPNRECGSPETELRSGWWAERECVCAQGRAQSCDASPHKPAPRLILNSGHAPLCANASVARPARAAPKASAPPVGDIDGLRR